MKGNVRMSPVGLALVGLCASACAAGPGSANPPRASVPVPVPSRSVGREHDAQTWEVLRQQEGEFLRGVWAFSDEAVWAVGHGGTIVHWDGAASSYSPSHVTDILVDVWSSAADELWSSAKRHDPHPRHRV